MNQNEQNPFQNLGAGPAQLYVVQPQAGQAARGKTTMAFALVTVLGAVVLAVGVMMAFRRPTEVEIHHPAPPPRVIVREVPAPRPAVTPLPAVATFTTAPERLPAPPPKSPPPPEPGPFDGVWRIVSRTKALPCFTLQYTGSATKGTYAPQNVSGTYPFVAGPVENDTLEFSCADYLGHRIYFAMNFESDTVARAWVWRRGEDVLADINSLATRRDLMPAQRRAQEIVLQRELQLAGTRIAIGKFQRVPDPGQEDK